MAAPISMRCTWPASEGDVVLRANDGQLDLAAPIVLTKPADDSKCELILTGTAGATLESVAIVSNARNVELYVGGAYVSTIRGEAVAGARDRFRVAAATKGAATATLRLLSLRGGGQTARLDAVEARYAAPSGAAAARAVVADGAAASVHAPAPADSSSTAMLATMGVRLLAAAESRLAAHVDKCCRDMERRLGRKLDDQREQLDRVEAKLDGLRADRPRPPPRAAPPEGPELDELPQTLDDLRRRIEVSRFESDSPIRVADGPWIKPVTTMFGAHEIVTHLRVAGDEGAAPPAAGATDDDATGLDLWRGATALASALEGEDVAGGTVLELGAGCGLPGLLAAKLGASRVFLTDKDPVVLEALRFSVAANFLENVAVAPLAYGDDAPAVDLVLAADALYLTCQVAPLIVTIDSAIAKGGTCLLAHEPRRAWKLDADRNPVQEAEDDVLAAFLAACAAAGLAADREGDRGDVRVYRIWSRPNSHCSTMAQC